MEFCVLGSGSKGNCVYLGDEETKVLVDCGLSGRQTMVRLKSVGVEPDSIDAVVITHEHNDHTAGVRVFCRRHNALVYANRGVLSTSTILQTVSEQYVREFETGTPFKIGSLLFEPFSVSHDAVDPVGFRVSSGDTALAVITDIGHVTALVRERVRALDALLIEFNHDPDLLNLAPYPWELKQRIRGRNGHLSNESAALLLEELVGGGDGRLRVIVAMHISEKSNDPGIVLETMKNTWKRLAQPAEPHFVAAGANIPTELFRL